MPGDLASPRSRRIPTPALRERLVAALRDGAAGEALCGETRVEYVPNWGGFVNASFRIRGRDVDVRAKLACEPDAIAAMRRWEPLATLLADRHHAPRWLGWMRVPDTAYEGALFAWVPGASPSRRGRSLLHRIAGFLAGLRRDAGLAAHLASPGTGTCEAVYTDVLGRRLREDLALLEASPPPFVGARDLAWMRREIDTLARRVEGSAAFDEAADVPSHGDLWPDNLLLGDDGRLVVLDWDGLGLGDAVFDWAAFLGPMRGTYRPARWEDVAERGWFCAAERERFDVYARAGLLDWVVDGLADWIDADALGKGAAAIRARKRASVEAARRAYHRAYPEA